MNRFSLIRYQPALDDELKFFLHVRVLILTREKSLRTVVARWSLSNRPACWHSVFTKHTVLLLNEQNYG